MTGRLDVGELAAHWRGHLALVHASPAGHTSLARVQRIVDAVDEIVPSGPSSRRAAGAALLLAAQFEIETGRVHPESAQVVAEAGIALLDAAALDFEAAFIAAPSPDAPDGAG